jgi:hypothetical protein
MSREERLVAYVDGALDLANRAAFEREMSADPALAAEVALHQRLGARIAQAYAPVLDEPVPAGLIAAASVANDRGRPRFGIPQWAAMAACLVVGVLAGRAALPQPGPLVVRDGALVARGGLAHALTTQLAADAGPVKLGVSFRSGDGRYCRSFQSAPDRLAGVACREADRWVARTTTAWTRSASPDYRTAGSDTPPEVLAAVDAMIAGEPLDAAAERAARAKAWRP